MEELFLPDTDILIVVGSNRSKCNGFVSTVAAMTWYGMKKTLTTAAPICVLADTDIFARHHTGSRPLEY